MDCQTFSQRLHHRLDRRESLGGDPDMQRHAEGCSACRDQLRTWLRIEEALPAQCEVDGPARMDPARKDMERPHAAPSPLRRPGLAGRSSSWAAGLAAALLIGVLLRGDSDVPPPGDVRVVVDSAGGDPVAAESIDRRFTAGADPSPWIRDLTERKWIDETMPAMRSVRDGVAPLGRSLLQAVTILSHGGGTKAS